MELDFDLLTWFMGIAALAVLMLILWRRGASLAYLSCLSIFWIYLLFVLKIAVFPIPVGRAPSQATAGDMLPVMLSSMQLKPFYFGPYATFSGVVIGILQNLLLTLPFGFGLRFVARLRGKRLLWSLVAFGLGIEVLQLIISLIRVFMGTWGPDHIVDVNDAILNVAGVLLGYGLFRVFALWYASSRHKFKDRGVFAYIQQVTLEG